MAAVGETSSVPLKTMDERPVVVRVKRKTSQSPLDAFWLEINERPLKRALLDLESLSISDATGKETLKTKKVLVQHEETVSSFELTDDIVQSFVEFDSTAASESTAKGKERRDNIKKEKEKLSLQRKDQVLSKARQAQEEAAKNARFEQIWRSRKGNKEVTHDKLHGMCQFYDVVRIDVEECSSKAQQYEETLEDQKLLSSYLPLLREFIPSAASEIESDLHAYSGNQESTDDFVYDIYTVNDEMEISETYISSPFPLVKVDEEEFYDGLDGMDYETDDSNAEDNPLNDYPEEEELSSEEDEKESEASDGESQENESESSELDVTKSCGLSGGDYFDEDEFDINEHFDDSDYDHDRGDNDVEHGARVQIS